MSALPKTAAGLLAMAVLLVGCGEILVDEQMVDLDATGQLRGFVFLDQNGNLQSDQGDEPLANLTVSVFQSVGGGEIASTITEGDGEFFLTEVPVGTYRLDVDLPTLPESFAISVFPEPFVVAADSITRLVVTASYPIYTLAEVLQLEPGIQLFTTGIALNARDPDGEGTVHLQNGTHYLRATDVVDAPIAAGDSVRFRGRTAVEAGLPVLDEVDVFFLQKDARPPVPLDVTTNEAVEAEFGGGPGSGGSLNAALVRIRDAEILDTATVEGHLVATVDDGTGPVDLVLRDYLAFDSDAFAPGFARIVEATGLLVAREDGGAVRWRLLPRSPGDVEVEEFPPLSLQQIRQLPSDRGATGDGIVLNPVDRPVPGTVHIREQGIHLRVRNLDVLGSMPAPGDSIRVRGHTNREALIFPVLDATDVTILSSGGANPQPAVRSTLVASTASGGQLADGLVRVEDADVQDTETVAGALIATVDDGSGPVDVIIYDAIGFTDSFVVPGRNLTSVTGVLVPQRDPLDGSVSWRIAPRFPSEIVD